MSKDPIPEFPSTVGKRPSLTFPDGSAMQWEVVDEIRRHEGDEKILLLQRMRAVEHPDQEMLRFAYYIIGKTGNKKGRWTWGQFAPFISADDFAVMVSEAKAKQWITEAPNKRVESYNMGRADASQVEPHA